MKISVNTLYKYTDNEQPKVYDLGIITTTLQDLLDNSHILIDSKRIIILKITNINLSTQQYLLNLQEYEGEVVDGLGYLITENDLIKINDSNNLIANSFIKSSEPLSLAQRKVDVLYGIIDQYTGEEITLSKATGTPTVDGIIYFQLGAEYFKRDFNDGVKATWFGLKADGLTASSASNTTALQNAINFCANFNVTDIILHKNFPIVLPVGDIYCGTINVKKNAFFKGQGIASTRLFYTGTDYFLRGDEPFIAYGGASDLQISPAPHITCLGLLYLKNAYNMNYDNISINGTTEFGVVSESVVRLESQQSWTVGANNNLYKIAFNNLFIYGSNGDCVTITGDYGSANISIKNSVIENFANKGVKVNSTSTVGHSMISITDVIFQGGGTGCVDLSSVADVDLKIYTETIISAPAIILGAAGAKNYKNVRIHDSQFGNGFAGGFGGAVIKGAAFDGNSLGNSGVIIENCSFLTTNSADFIAELACVNVTIKNIKLDGTAKVFKPITYVDGTDNGLGNWEIDLTNNRNEADKTEVTTGTIIPKGLISYWKGNKLVSTNIRRAKFITGDFFLTSKNEIYSDIFLSSSNYIDLGSANNLYSLPHELFTFHNRTSNTTELRIFDGGLINGVATYVLPAKTSIKLMQSDVVKNIIGILYQNTTI